MGQQLRTDVFEYAEHAQIEGIPWWEREHIEPVGRAIQIDMIDIDELNAVVEHLPMGIDIPDSKNLIAERKQH